MSRFRRPTIITATQAQSQTKKKVLLQDLVPHEQRIPLPLVIGIDLGTQWKQTCVLKSWQTIFTTRDPKMIRVGPIHLDMSVAMFLRTKGSLTTSFGSHATLLIGKVGENRRVTLFGDPAHYVGREIVIRVRGKSEKTGHYVWPFETVVDGDDMAASLYGQRTGMCGVIVRTNIKEDTGRKLDERGDMIIAAATGVDVQDYAALGEFIVEYRRRAHESVISRTGR